LREINPDATFHPAQRPDSGEWAFGDNLEQPLFAVVGPGEEGDAIEGLSDVT
jgi:hypothetical protein